MICIFLIASAIFTGVEGLYEGIDDITNNLATDLAPLITLFGEQATKQFLSESTSFMDSIIFSIAPLGLITAVVSVIRIYGSSSFKSIIGRSQEAHGVAEAELCSSTSQDVCELWSNGGICRVFGRPKILDFFYETKIEDDFYPKYRKHQRQDVVEIRPSCGIYRPNMLLVNRDEEMRQKLLLFNWKEVSSSPLAWRKSTSRHSGTQPQDVRTRDEPSANPNLTLNIGMSKVSKKLHWSVLIFGVLVQLSFLGYATWATFYNPSFLNEGTPSSQARTWFALTISGTLMLVCGMTLCARMIDLKSRERKFKRIGGTSKIFWLQPGGQRIGDQLFHAFAYSEEKDYYITSSRLENTQRERMLFLAVISTTLGWVLQFVGLRGSPGSIALFQFIATLIMSLLRAALRGRRLGADENRFESQIFKKDNLIEGHELDWQAMNIDQNDQHYEWRLSDHFMNEDQHDDRNKISEGVTVKSTKHLRAYYTMNDDLATNAANCASEWIASQEAQNSPSVNAGAKIMRFRSRLAELTGVQFGLPPEQAWDSETRTTALQLQKALQVSAEYIFALLPLEPSWRSDFGPKAIAWKSSCFFSKFSDQTSQEEYPPRSRQEGEEDHLIVGFQMYNRDGKWNISSHQLEAVLGLWSWSLKRSGLFSNATAEEDLIRSKMVVVENSKRDDIKAALYLWVTQTLEVRGLGAVDGISRPDNLSILTSCLLIRAESLRQCSGGPRQTHTPNTDGFTILTIPTNGSTSLLQLMAQDIYTTFINRVVGIVVELHDMGERDDYLRMQNRSISTGSGATPWLGLSNVHIDALADIIISAGVATREEALMSIVPAFLRRMKLPYLEDDVVESLLDRAKSLRRISKFQDGAALFILILSRYPAKHHKRALRCLGDLYRRAARSPKGIDQEFGRTGMKDLKQRHSALASDHQTEDVLRCYEHIYRHFRVGRIPQRFFSYGDFQQFMQKANPKDRQKLEYALTMIERQSFTGIEKLDLSGLLTWAIENEVPELIEDLWPNARSPRDGSGESLVPIALAHNCELETFHSLLDWPQIDLDAVGGESAIGDRSTTPLIYAIEANRLDVVRSILRRGANVQQWDRDGMKPLHRAFRKSNEEMIRLLLDKGAMIHEPDERGRKALHLAAEANTEVVIHWLLKIGADIHEKDASGHTALHFAARANGEDVVRLLIEKGAERHGKDAKGRTPLHFAAEGRNRVIIEFLLKNGAEVHEKDEKGQTPLHLAAAEQDGEEVTRLLLQKGADAYEKDDEGRTAFHVAAQRHHQCTLRLLLERSAENGVVDAHCWSSLWSVIGENDKEMAQLLEEKGIGKPLSFRGKEGEMEEAMEEGEE